MIDPKQQLQALLELADGRGLEIRQESLGGEGGALCKIKGKFTLFVDQSSDVVTQVAKTAEALARLEGWDEIYMRPDVRVLLEKFRSGDDS